MVKVKQQCRTKQCRPFPHFEICHYYGDHKLSISVCSLHIAQLTIFKKNFSQNLCCRQVVSKIFISIALMAMHKDFHGSISCICFPQGSFHKIEHSWRNLETTGRTPQGIEKFLVLVYWPDQYKKHLEALLHLSELSCPTTHSR
jgi:hypothetical protein